jgi:transcriptional regulator with XRE-family HTH domain
MYFSQNINHLLTQRGWRTADLARALNISRTQAGRYVNGENEPKIETVISMSKLFDVNIDDLILKDLSKENARPFGAEGEDTASTDETLIRMNELLEQRVKVLEREILRDNPDLAADLGITE